MPAIELQSMCIENDGKLLSLQSGLENAKESTDDLLSQRKLLLVRYVGSQKLGLAASNASCHRAKQRAFSRWLQ